MQGADWTDTEIDATVADYFAMLTLELAGTPYNKSAHRRGVLTLIDRAPGAIEFKHQNISAVLLGLGYPWIDGYKPATNFQTALVDGVLRHLRRHPTWFNAREQRASTASRIAERKPLWIGPPPTHSNMPPTVDLKVVRALAEKYDVAERDARNRELGRAGEERIFEYERTALRLGGRTDLAEKVRWTARDDGDGAGYDIASFEPDGKPRLIEVKTTLGWERTPFHITRNELDVANAKRDIWHLVRLWNFAKEPRAYSLRPPLEAYAELTPTSFIAELH